MKIETLTFAIKRDDLRFCLLEFAQINFGDNHIIIRPIIPRALWIPIVQFQI